MANVYVYSGAGGSGTGADWTNAYTTLSAAAAAKAAGDDFWVGSDHAESTGAAVTITFPGTAASPNRCMSVSRAGSTPPVAADITAGAGVTTTGANALNIDGSAYVYGVAFSAGTGVTAASLNLAGNSGNFQNYDTCTFALPTSSTGSRIKAVGASQAAVNWNNCTISFGNASQGLSMNSGGSFSWINKPGSTAYTGATIVTNLIATAGTHLGHALFDGLDLSALGSGKTIVGTSQAALVTLQNCKLDASVTVSITPTVGNARGIRLIGSGSTTNVSRNELWNYQGTLTTETTIKRTAGASDGTTAYCWKVVTTANAKRTFPFETFEGAVWNTTLSSLTLTVHTVTDNVTLTDAEIWLEVEYLGSSATPVATLITDANATVLTTAANQTSDSGEAWTTTGLTTPVKQALAVTFTPAMVGPIRWKVKVAKASATVYIDPNVDIA